MKVDVAVRRHLFATGLLVALAASLILVTSVMVLIPLHQPQMATKDRYASLAQHRVLRRDVHSESPAPSVRQLAVVPAVLSPPAAIERLRIARIGVDAPVVEMGIGPDHAMESPPGPEVVAWYRFTGKPGAPGNAVFSGHVDYHDYGKAVFWSVRSLQPGDTIEVGLADGVRLTYAVTTVQLYPAEAVPMAEVLASSPAETITLITCAGTFQGGSYSARLIVRALRTG